MDRSEWDMTPPTVNAYYDPQMNNINFPAGILQPPFFDNHMDDAVNFGGIGMVIGHELTHGFDDQGRQFDAEGNLQELVDARGRQEVRPARGLRGRRVLAASSSRPACYVNGKLTLGENTADNGGVRVALMALLNTIGNKTAEDRRLHARAAILPLLRAGLVRKRARRRRCACRCRPTRTRRPNSA